MRFLILTQYFWPEIGASQVRLAAITQELQRFGHEVEIVTALPNYPTGQIFPKYKRMFYHQDLYKGMRVHRVWLYPSMGTGLKRIVNYASFMFTSLWGLFKAKKPDIVFVESPPLFLGVPGYVAARLWRVPLVFNVADLWPDSVRELGIMRDGPILRIAERLEHWIYANATYINAVTEGIRSTLLTKKGIPESKICFLPNGVDTNLFAPQSADIDLAHQIGLNDQKVVLYAGTHGYAHGMGVALEAAKLLADERIVFVFVGAGSEKGKLMSMAGEMGLKNVCFLKPAPPEHIARLYSISCAGLSTLRDCALFEGTRPVKILAAMASGKPVLYSGAGEGARLVEEARAGVVTAPEDPVALAEAILLIADNPALANELGRNGRAFVKRHLSWSALVCDWLKQVG